MWESKGLGKKEKARVTKNMIMHRCAITFLMVIYDRIFLCVIADTGLYSIGTRKLAITRIDNEKITVSSTAECNKSGTKRSIKRTRSYGDTFDLSMEPAVEFMEYDRSDEYLE